jgi:hypothetical protein
MNDRLQPNPSPSHRFEAALAELFPGAIRLEDYFEKTTVALIPDGFVDDNTLGIVATCRDEIASPLETQIIQHWGRTFSCRSLGGFLLLGRTGIKTGISHAPLVNHRRRFVMYAMPHIALSDNGVPGVVMREGIEEASHACGSLDAVVSQLKSGRIDLHMDFEDLEQSCVRQKLLSNLHYGEEIDLVNMTRLAAKIIHKDTDRLLSNLARPNEYDFALFIGILIHGPNDQNWVWHEHAEVQTGSEPGHRRPLDLKF